MSSSHSTSLADCEILEPMSRLAVFIFDEIFEAMVTAEQKAQLRALDAELHIVSKKCNIAAYGPMVDPATEKILCINPDFVDWDFSSSDYQDIPGLKAIIGSTDNSSWLDAAYADSHDIQCVALEHLTTEYAAVAEYAITIMMSLARTVPLQNWAGFPLDYGHDFLKYQAMDIAGKTAGIVGLGNVGGAIAKLCKGLGMRVVYWSRSKKAVDGYEYRELDDVLREADVVFPTLKPNDQTKLMLPNEKLEFIQHHAIVVSVVGALVNNDYLVRRVAEKKLFGFGFDATPGTFANYAGNVWAIPDYAWATKNNMQATYNQFVEKIIAAVI